MAPQLAFDAPDSSAGNFWKPGHFAAYIDEAAERLMRLYGDKPRRPALQRRAAWSSSPTAAAISRPPTALLYGGAAHRIKGVILMDSLYGDEDKFAAWAAARRRLAFLLSAYTDSTKDENATLRGLLDKRRIPHADALPKALTPGTFAFVAVRFAGHAWRFYDTRLGGPIR